jgi:TolB-like protein
VQFLFDDHVLDTDRRELHCGCVPIALEPQVFDLLTYLVQNRDRVVSKDDLIASVWGGRIVSESTLTSRVNATRKAIGDSGEEQKLIRTFIRKGFRFVGDVHVQSDKDPRTSVDLPNAERPRPALLLPDRPAIAVLPFTNMSGDPEQEYFSDGISEDIVTAISKLRWFFVIARNSSFAYKGKPVPMKQIGEELGVGYLVEGSVRKSGDRVRITAQLNDVATGNQLWAERYDRGLADVFAVQDEITEAIVAAIEPQIYAAENFRTRRKPPESLDAWDPERAALAAIRADSEDPWAHLALAGVNVYQGRLQDALAEFEEALSLNPNFAPALAYYGQLLSWAGRRQEGIIAARPALRLCQRDPFSAIVAYLAAGAEFTGGHYHEAMRLAREAIRQRPDFVGAYRVLTAAAAMAGEIELAKASLQELRRAQPNISPDWIAQHVPVTQDERDSEAFRCLRDLYLEAFRRAGLE